MVNAYTPFAASLIARTQLAQNFVRLTFTGPQLTNFGTACLDQRIKLVFGTTDQTAGLLNHSDWLTWWREVPNTQRPPMRTYTVRNVRPEHAQVDVDFVTHGTAGPASRFALEAPLGADLVIIGPDAHHPGAHTDGIAWKPASATHFLIAGDETALPAIANIVRSLPPESLGLAAIEVPTAADRHHLPCPPGVELTWLPRDGTPRGDQLCHSVLAWFDARRYDLGDGAKPPHDYEDIPESGGPGMSVLWDEAGQPGAGVRVGGQASGLYTWIAAEAGVVARLRRALRRDRGVDKAGSSFMGYWRVGHQLE